MFTCNFLRVKNRVDKWSLLVQKPEKQIRPYVREKVVYDVRCAMEKYIILPAKMNA